MSTSPALLDAYTAEFAPRGPVESTLVQRLAVLTARLDLLARAFDALPALCEPQAHAEYRAEQFDLRVPYAGLLASPAPHGDDRNEPIPPPDLAARTLVYALTSPRAALLLRHENAADRRYIATLHELQRLQAARPRTVPSQPGIPAHLQAISDSLDRGWQLLPPDHPLALSQNEPSGPTLADLHSTAQNEPNSAAIPPRANPPAAIPSQDRDSSAAPTRPQSAVVRAIREPAAAGGQSQAQPETQNEPDSASTPPCGSPVTGGTIPVTLIAKSKNEANRTCKPPDDRSAGSSPQSGRSPAPSRHSQSGSRRRSRSSRSARARR